MSSAANTVAWNVVSFAVPPLAALGCGIWASKTEKLAPLVVVLAAPFAVLFLNLALQP